ncbi:MAG TPA: hypothetical protein VF666_11225 [Pyrinomonadaceae bacterium]|jgi:hypothetical protein
MKTENEEADVFERGRRRFLVGAGAGVLGLGIVSLCPSSIVQAEPYAVPAGWKSFFKSLFRFAGQLGMTALSFSLAHYLNSLNPGVRQEIDGSLSKISTAGYGAEPTATGRVMANESSFFTPLVNPTQLQNGFLLKAYVVPFYDVSRNPESRLGSVLSTPTMATMPSVAEDLERIGFSTAERSNLLLPTRAKLNSYNTENLPDTYLTRGGSVEADYRPIDANSGDLRVRVTRKRDGKSERLEPLLEKTYGVELAA